MAKGISIGIASDTRAFSQGIKSGVVEPLDDVKDKLDEIARAGDQSGNKLTDTLREEQAQTKNLRRDYQDVTDTIKSGSRSMSSSVANDASSGGFTLGREFKKGAKEAGEGLAELKDSSRQNATEVAASFDGSATSIAQGFQAVASEALAGFGPVGAGIGFALAAGIGIFQTALGNAQQRTQELQAKVQQLTDDLIASGKKVASTDFLNESIKAVIEDTGKLNEATRKHTELGVSMRTAIRAEAGDTKALNEEIAATEKLYKAANKAADDPSSDKATKARAGNLRDEVTALKAARDANKDAAKNAQLYKDATNDAAAADTASGKAAQKAAAERKAAQKDSKAATEEWASSVQEAYHEAGADVDDFYKNGKFDLDGYTKAAEANAQALVDYQKNMATAETLLAKGGHDKAIQYLESLGPDAAPLIDAFVKAPAAKQKELESTWDTLGNAAGSSFTTQLQKSIPSTVNGPTVKVGVDRTALDNILNNAAFRTGLTIPVSLVDSKSGQGVRLP